jgi:hypothetical protein
MAKEEAGDMANSAVGSVTVGGHEAIRMACAAVPEWATLDVHDSARRDQATSTVGIEPVATPMAMGPTRPPLPKGPPPTGGPEWEAHEAAREAWHSGAASDRPAMPKRPPPSPWAGYTPHGTGHDDPNDHGHVQRGKWHNARPVHSNSMNPPWISGPRVMVTGYKIIVRDAWFSDKLAFLLRLTAANIPTPDDVAISAPAQSGTLQVFLTYKNMIHAQVAYTAIGQWWCEYPHDVAGTRERGPCTCTWASMAYYT